MSIAEDDLTPERSSKAVNRCIVDLSLGRNYMNDVVGRWGDVSTRWTILLLLSFDHIMPYTVSFIIRVMNLCAMLTIETVKNVFEYHIGA